MGRLQTWGAAARRSPVFWVAFGRRRPRLVAGACRAGHPRASRRPSATRPTSTRAVALGDSVPYGHGLANPYLTPAGRASRHRRVAGSLDRGLPEPGRPGPRADHDRADHQLPGSTGDQLAISGAVADAADNTARDGQCPAPAAAGPQPQRRARRGGPGPAPGAAGPAAGRGRRHRLRRLPGVRAGPRPRRRHRHRDELRRQRAVTPELATDLAECAHEPGPGHRGDGAARRHASAVLDYYQPIPSPGADRRRHLRLRPAHQPRLQRAQVQTAQPPMPRPRSCSPR